MHQARTITCFQCGGDVQLSLEQPQTSCPFCQVPLQLDEHLRHEAAGYERIGKALLGREALARRKAAMHARAARHNGPMIGLAVMFALVVTWWFVAGVSGVASKVSFGVNAGLVLFSILVIVGFGWVWANMMKAPQDEELGAVGLAMCDNCGAFIPFKQGEALSGCQYCHAHALKPSTLALELLAGGREALRGGQRAFADAEADNWRTAREARLLGVRFGAAGWTLLVVVAACGMTAALIAGMLSSSAGESSTWWIWLAIISATAGSVSLVVRAMKELIADNADFERRFGVRIMAGADVYQPTTNAAPPPIIHAPSRQ